MLASMKLDEVARARRDPGVVVLEGFHAVKHAVRFGADLLGLWTADADEFAALVVRLAPDIALDPVVVEAAELAKVVPRAQVLAVARHPAQLDPDGIVAQADPAPVIQALMTVPVVRRFRLRQVVTTVDAMHGVRTLDQHPESIKQAAVADDIVITKVDLRGPSLCAFKPVDGGVIFRESEITITDAPGLGIREIRGLEALA